MIRTVVHFTEGAVFGGTEQVMLHLLDGLDRTRWQPVVLHHAAPGLAPLLARAGRLEIETRAVPRVASLRRPGGLPGFLRSLRGLRPDVFHAHLTWPLACTYALVAATLARVQAVVATDHLCVDLNGARSSLYLQPRLIAMLVDHYLAVSEAVAAQLRSPYRIPARKISVVPNGIPLSPFDTQAPSPALRASLARTAAGSIVLTTARLDLQKGHHYLLRAATRVPEATFVLVGDGPQRTSLEGLARELGVDDRLVFLGHRDDVPALLASCDLFVLPSLYEGLPLSLLEAMAAARPVVASAVGGTIEAVRHAESGLLVPPADPLALADAIRAVLADPDEAQRLGRAAQARVRRSFSAKSMVQRVEAIYDELLGPPVLGRAA